MTTAQLYELLRLLQILTNKYQIDTDYVQLVVNELIDSRNEELS